MHSITTKEFKLAEGEDEEEPQGRGRFFFGTSERQALPVQWRSLVVP